MKGRTDMTISRSTNYIQFVNTISTSATLPEEFIEAVKKEDGWHIVNQAQEEYFCPIGTLRIMLEHGKDVKMFTI